MNLYHQSFWRKMLMLLVMSCIGLLASCDGGDIEAHNRPLTVVDDQALAAGSSDLLALKLSDWTGVSASGETVDVEITYSADLPAQWFDKSKILLRVQLLPVAGGVPYSAQSVEVLAGQISGSLSMSVPTTNAPFTIAADVYQPRTKRVLVRTNSAAALNVTLLSDLGSELPPGAQLVPEIVPQSYTQTKVGERMLHRFAVRVFDAEENVPGRKTLPGLGNEPERYFTALENGVSDVESPVTVDATRQRVQVYFVLDASYSIVLAGAAEALKRSAARTVMGLHAVADFNYRQFSGPVRALNNIDSMIFDDATSATALYFALDTALQDIEQHADPLAHKVVIAFTDGRDYSSINRYPEVLTEEGMLEHATRLVSQARERVVKAGGGLELHVVSVGDADIDALDRLAGSGAGIHLSAGEWSGVGAAFEDVTRHVLSTYFLEYSSQRTSLPTQLELEVHVGDAQALIPVE